MFFSWPLSQRTVQNTLSEAQLPQEGPTARKYSIVVELGKHTNGRSESAVR